LSSTVSIQEVLAQMEKEMAFHKEQAEHHAQQEVFHRERHAAHASEYEAIAKHYETFKASAGAVAEIAARAAAAAAPKPEPKPAAPPGPVTRKPPAQLVARLLAELPAGEDFTPTGIAAEVNRRYRSELKKPLTAPTASTILRRMAADRRIRLVQQGGAHTPAVYRRG
jgi:hypothetical protein